LRHPRGTGPRGGSSNRLRRARGSRSASARAPRGRTA
jgi:hypothetical protein